MDDYQAFSFGKWAHLTTKQVPHRYITLI